MTNATMTRDEFRALLESLKDLPEDEAARALHDAIVAQAKVTA
ncbi:hypothetical protein [Agromyces bauzanensis]